MTLAGLYEDVPSCGVIALMLLLFAGCRGSLLGIGVLLCFETNLHAITWLVARWNLPIMVVPVAGHSHFTSHSGQRSGRWWLTVCHSCNRMSSAI